MRTIWYVVSLGVYLMMPFSDAESARLDLPQNPEEFEHHHDARAAICFAQASCRPRSGTGSAWWVDSQMSVKA
jgi:hypothetical protein